MNLAAKCKEKIVIHHRGTSTQSPAKALITPDTIIVADAQVTIEPNDIIERTIPSGVVERYVVEDPGFIARLHGTPDHYQVKVRREGRTRPAVMGGHNIHLSGSNARVNIDSMDNSTNTVGLAAPASDSLHAELQLLRRELVGRAADSPENYVAIGTVAAAEAAAREGDETKASALLRGIGSASSWVFAVAKEIGVKLIVEAVQKHSGI